MTTYGRQLLTESGRAVMVACDMDMDWKTGGITLAWVTVAAALAATKLPDDTPIRIGQKFLRFGQILCLITQHEVETVTINGAPTGGTFIISYTDPDGQTHDTDPIAYNASAAALEAALEAVGAEVTVSKASNVFTVTFDDDRNVPALTANAAGLTGGTSPSIAIATTTQGTSDLGKYGPYDPAAVDGRQLLTRGECFILNETVVEDGLVAGAGGGVTDHPAVFSGGRAWKARILMTAGAHSLAAGPTVAEFEAAFPRIEYVQNK